MYTNVHMNYILPITALRKDIFAIMDRVAKTGDVIEVEKEGKRIVKIVPVTDDAAGKAAYVLANVLPGIKGIWKDVPLGEFRKVNAFMRGKKEKSYWKRKYFQ